VHPPSTCHAGTVWQRIGHGSPSLVALKCQSFGTSFSRPVGQVRQSRSPNSLFSIAKSLTRTSYPTTAAHCTILNPSAVRIFEITVARFVSRRLTKSKPFWASRHQLHSAASERSFSHDASTSHQSSRVASNSSLSFFPFPSRH
jgi:hypothetical protein